MTFPPAVPSSSSDVAWDAAYPVGVAGGTFPGHPVTEDDYPSPLAPPGGLELSANGEG